MQKSELGQFYSTNFNLIKSHIKHITPDKILIDPFAGKKDLLNFFDNQYEAYDLVPFEDVIVNDSLKTPPDYTNKFIITNPPYLAQNKTKLYKDIFKMYDTDDLYKATLLSFINAATEGIIIIPAGFWFNEKNSKIRKTFLKYFQVDNVDVFNKIMFGDTTYTVSSFYFYYKEHKNSYITHFNFYEKDENTHHLDIEYNDKNNYTVLKEIENKLIKHNLKINRYTINSKPESITNIYLHCIDTPNHKIYACLKEPYMGKNTDRAFLTLTIDNHNLTLEEQEQIVQSFNTTLNNLREQYLDSFLSNYRNEGRKRIGFKFAYNLFGHVIIQLNFLLDKK